MDILQIALALLDIVDATATAVSLVALGETWRRLGQADDDQTASHMSDIEQFIGLTRMHAQRHR